MEKFTVFFQFDSQNRELFVYVRYMRSYSENMNSNETANEQKKNMNQIQLKQSKAKYTLTQISKRNKKKTSIYIYYNWLTRVRIHDKKKVAENWSKRMNEWWERVRITAPMLEECKEKRWQKKNTSVKRMKRKQKQNAALAWSLYVNGLP